MIRLFAGLAILIAAALPARAQIEIVPVTSPGGITAWLVEDQTIPIITIEASFRGGAVLDAPEKAGATNLMAALLEEGAGEMSATDFARAREDLAARFSFDGRLDSVSVSAEMLAENRDASIELLRAALIEPRFDADAFERVRAQVVASLRSDETDPQTMASRAFFAKAFDGYPYARPVDGTLETVAALKLEDMREAYRNALVRDRLYIAVVGAITPDELAPLLDRLVSDLPVGGPPLPEIATPELNGSTTVIDLDIPQSVVVFGQPGIARDDPDFIPAFVLDHILGGGGFGSRLTEEIREKRGLTYGVGTYLAPYDFGWLYQGQFSSSNARVAEALDILRAEWARMAEEGVSAEELEAAKQFLTGAYPLRFDGNARIASQLLGLQTAGLGMAYVNTRNDQVNAVTVEEIARVAKRLMQPEALTTVIVGRPEGVAPTN